MDAVRRALLLSPALLLAPALLLGARPGRCAEQGAAPGQFRLAAAPGERVVVTSRCARGGVTLPATRARLLAELAFGTDRAALVAFAADAAPSTACDLMAVIGADAVGLRLLAIEVLEWRRNDGAHLGTHAAVTPDGARLVLAREAARPLSDRLVWRREAWTDALAWRGGQAMPDAPLRPRRPGTWQASLGEGRAQVAALLEPARTGTDDQLLAAACRVAPPPAG